MTNIVLAAISLFVILLITSTLVITKPIDPASYGVVVTNVNQGSLAESIGLDKGTTIQQIQNNQIRNPAELNENLNANLGKLVTIGITDENGSEIN